MEVVHDFITDILFVILVISLSIVSVVKRENVFYYFDR